MTNQEKKEILLKDIRWEIETPRNPGGQSVGIPAVKVILIHDGLDIKISMGIHRSQYKNKEMALLMFDLFLEDFLK